MPGTVKTKLIIVAAACLLLLPAMWFAYTRLAEQHTQLSIKPAVKSSNTTLQAVESTLGLRAKIPYSTIKQAAEQATDQPQSGEGERQTCKRILGAKVCATVQWQYLVEKAGDINVVQSSDAVRVSIPLSLNGAISVDGRGGKLLGLRNKNVTGVLELAAELKVGMDKNWCPAINSKLNYRWISDPRIRLIGKLKINMRKSVNKALDKKLGQLEEKFSSLLDCDKFRKKIASNWKVHHIPLNIPGQDQAYLELTPTSAAVSNATAHETHVEVAVEMYATTQVVHSQSNQQQLAVPDLQQQVATPGAVEFSLLINLPYSQLNELLKKNLLGKVQQTNGRIFQITSIETYPSGDRLIFDTGFEARGFGKFLKTSGHLYLSARPVANPQSNNLHFEDLRFTRILDNELWSVLSGVLHKKILQSLNEAAIIDLAPQMKKLEKSIVSALSNPEKTAGIAVNASTPEVRLVTVNPQSASLAAIIHVSTQLDATIPPAALLRDK